MKLLIGDVFVLGLIGDIQIDFLVITDNLCVCLNGPYKGICYEVHSTFHRTANDHRHTPPWEPRDILKAYALNNLNNARGAQRQEIESSPIWDKDQYLLYRLENL